MSISDKAFAAGAKTLGVEEAAIRAVTEVESSGNGFLSDGRPKILFERHIMYRQLSASKGVAAAQAAMKKAPDVVNTQTGSYKGGTAEHDRLGKAAQIDRTCALESCSWGAFQIMGFHWKSLGYSSIQEFVNAMYASDDKQLDAFIRFIKINPNLLNALKNLNWQAFALGYNGKAYSKNQYDIKMKNAYNKFSSK